MSLKRFETIRHVRMSGLCTTALCAGFLLSQAALGQSHTQSNLESKSPQSNAAAASSADDSGIPNIIVTAEKRSEGLQNIPIAITAITGETLDKAGVMDVGDLVQLTPSLQFGTRSTNVFIAVRGIGQSGQDIGSQSGVTVAIDGVPLLNHFMMNPTFLDIERVEVLRGPQGTIAGRNATGGAINVHSKGPTDKEDGEVALTIGNYGRLGAKGYVNAPISDVLEARMSFQEERADGWLPRISAFAGSLTTRGIAATPRSICF
jgi:iron complex outermembrane receptor protein